MRSIPQSMRISINIPTAMVASMPIIPGSAVASNGTSCSFARTLSASAATGAYAFQTPIGSTHTFQGWADLFTTTPKESPIDTFATLGFTVQSVSVYAERHQFRSDVKDIDFGHELDVRLSYPALKSLTARLEFADYNAVSATAGKPVTRKIWATLLYTY